MKDEFTGISAGRNLLSKIGDQKEFAMSRRVVPLVAGLVRRPEEVGPGNSSS